jgi:hypothetical protein
MLILVEHLAKMDIDVRSEADFWVCQVQAEAKAASKGASENREEVEEHITHS